MVRFRKKWTAARQVAKQGEQLMRSYRHILAGILIAANGLTLWQPAYASKDLFVIDLPGEPSSLDPHVQWNPDSYNVYRNVFDNLVTRDDAGKIVPQIATSWDYVSDTRIRFKIRDDVSFHDGTKLTADDVVFSVKRITDPAFASPQLGQFNQITDAVADDPTTVTLTTNGPYPPLFAQLVKLSIVPKHVVEKAGKDAFNIGPVGSGPYRFETWQRGVEVTLVRNDAYWGARGAFPKVVFRAVPDAATRVANLQAGASDLVTYLNGDLVAQIEASGKGKALVGNTERVAYLGMNVTKPPLDKPQVREAIAMALDKVGITDGILATGEKPVPEIASPAHMGWVEGITAAPYDAARAKEIMSSTPGADTPIKLLTSPVYDQRVVQAIQQMLNDAGMKIEIEMTDMPNWLKQMQGGPGVIPAIAFSRWSCGCQDADGILYPLLHSSSGWSSIKDGEIDAALDLARKSLSEEERLAAYKKVHEKVNAEHYIIPLYQAAVVYGAAEQVSFMPTPNESIFLNRITWTD
jgi:peptide/nickel transport system substrate-binding protein